jgi:hypothetical protein
MTVADAGLSQAERKIDLSKRNKLALPFAERACRFLVLVVVVISATEEA